MIFPFEKGASLLRKALIDCACNRAPSFMSERCRLSMVPFWAMSHGACYHGNPEKWS